ncbi:MAG: hypothetical protein AB2L18_07600 [Anaerolineaceae bacterium]
MPKKIAFSSLIEERNGHYTYLKLAGTIEDEHNVQILNQIAQEELTHCQIWKR